jgi:hypothetical protein
MCTTAKSLAFYSHLVHSSSDVVSDGGKVGALLLVHLRVEVRQDAAVHLHEAVQIDRYDVARPNMEIKF